MTANAPKPATRRSGKATATARAAAAAAAEVALAAPAETPEPIATDEGELRADVAATLAKLRYLRKNVLGPAQDEEKELLADVRAAVKEGDLPAGEYFHGGEKVLTLSRPESFDAATAETAVPESLRPYITKRTPDAGLVAQALADGVITQEQHDAITTAGIDRGLAKDNLPPALYRACCRPAANPTIKAV